MSCHIFFARVYRAVTEVTSAIDDENNWHNIYPYLLNENELLLPAVGNKCFSYSHYVYMQPS